MKRFVAVFAALALANCAFGTDLIGVYQDALKFDTQIREADATRMAAREANPQAWAALLPQISGSFNRSVQQEDSTEVFPYPGPNGAPELFAEPSVSHVNTHGYEVQLQQSVFSWANFAGLAQAHKKVAEAEATYRAAEEDLIQRVATAYFNVLNAQDNLDAQQAALDAVTRQLDQANKRYEVGLIAITDVKEAQAAHDAAAAAVIAAKRTLANMEQALREITEQDYPMLAKPGDDMPLELPKPADPGRWVSVSMDQNLNLVSARLAADVARDQVSIAFGGHLPQISITASHTVTNEQTDESLAFAPFGVPVTLAPQPTFPFALQNNQIGLQVTLPIFSGGMTQSQVRQAQYQWIAAKDQVQLVSRQTEHQARDAYNGVVSDVAQVQSLKQGVVSAQVALKATEAGYDVGTRTAVEVLQQRQLLVQAETNYAQAKYQYLLDIVQLREAAGTLDVNTLSQIDRWLTVNQSTSTSPVTDATPDLAPTPGAAAQPGGAASEQGITPEPQSAPPPSRPGSTPPPRF
ncbi:MAG TPA: TolC family outer membrane protein [Steroidobacteraceae bacterium]|nr:TolC family outer membrane protein [Steroidobacteraceae bacterium]